MDLHLEAHGNACTGHALSARVHGAVRVGRVNIDATAFSAAQSGHSSPRLQGVFVFSWQLWLWQGPDESAPAAQPPRSKTGLEAASLMELLVQLIFCCTQKAVVFFGRQTLCHEDTFCIQHTHVEPG